MIQTETTPNPESIKFLSENTISAVGTEEFQKKNVSKISNKFVKELLNFNGVELVLLSKNFLSVKKTKDVNWDELKPMVISHMNDYFANHKKPILEKEIKDENDSRSDDDVIKFEVNKFKKYCLLNGLDDIGLTMQKNDKINDYEARLKINQPW